MNILLNLECLSYSPIENDTQRFASSPDRRKITADSSWTNKLVYQGALPQNHPINRFFEVYSCKVGLKFNPGIPNSAVERFSGLSAFYLGNN